jgi:putative hydrolase of the HAD superfamily
MTTIISFDLDGTITTSDYADHVWLEGLPRIYAKEKNTSYRKAKQILINAYDAIGDHKSEWYDLSYWFIRYRLKTPWQNLLKQYTHYIQPYQDALYAVKKLAPRFPLIITSNAIREFIEIELQSTVLTDYFYSIYSSLSDFKQVKKHPNVYQQICDVLQIETHDLIHVGDRYDYDYISPKKIGVQAYHLDRNQTNQRTSFTVFSLYEFLDKIHNMN